MHPPTTQPVEKNLAALDKSFEVFLDAATHYPRELVRQKPNESAFSATEIVYHMLDVERLWQRRMRGLWDGTMNKFQQMDPDKEAREQRYNERPYDEGITELKHARVETHTLVQEMKPQELQRTAIHSTYGEMDTFAILKTMEQHDRTHAAQLGRTLAQVSQTNVASRPMRATP